MASCFCPLKKFTLSLTVLAILLIGLFSWSCSPKEYSGQVESISIGFQADQSATEAYVAQDKGFFAPNGLNISIKPYDTGAAAVNGMLNDELDFAGAAEITLVGKSFEHQAISTIAVANKLETFYLVARRDKGIENIADLNGKKISVGLQTIGAFYLSRFLTLNGISPSKVTMVDMLPSQSSEALINGTVDAVAFTQPNVDTLEKQLGTNAISWGIQGNQMIFGMFIGKNAWITAHPDLVKRFLKALEQADEYIMGHPDEVKTVLKNRFNYTDEYLALVLPENDFSLSLDQALIAAMEDEARWMISSNMTTAKEVPNFNDYIYEDALKLVKPEAVNIVR